MYKELIYMCIGIYLVILSLGFSALVLLKYKYTKLNSRKEIMKRILKNEYAKSQDEETQDTLGIREVNVSTQNEKTKAFPFLNDPNWESLIKETESLNENELKETELLNNHHDELSETELLEEEKDNETTELLEDNV